MYSGKFVRIKKAAQDTEIPESELIGLALDGDLSIYAWDKSWVRERTEYPFNRINFTSPVLMDDEILIATLVNGESASLERNAEYKVICYRDSTDDNHLDGVEVTQRNLYCLKSEIESIKNNQTKQTKKREDSVCKLCESDDLSSQSGIEPASTKDIDANQKILLAKPKKNMLEEQQVAILKVINLKNFKSTAIPRGEKGTIKDICESDYAGLFKAHTAFDRAWKLGIKILWKMEFHESYARRGIN